VDGNSVPVLAIIFVATLIRSAFGFGEALVAVPLLALLIPVEVAVPLAVLLSITVAGVVVVQDWHHIHVRSAGWLLLFTLFGIPVGLLVLTAVAEAVLKAVLGLVIMAFSLYCLVSRQPLVVYGTLRRWSPAQFRATLQGYFLPASLLGMVGYSLAGLWVPAVTRYYLLSLPLALAAIFLGRAVNQRLDGRRFLRYVHSGLLAVGTALLIQALHR
jgi:uncharacterized membrane protein YfcA